MNKSNLALSGLPPLTITEDQIIGYVIYRPSTEEFFCSHKSGIGYSADSYTKEPSFAYCFSTKQLAFRHSTFILDQTQVLPLFDLGDKLGVMFDCN